MSIFLLFRWSSLRFDIVENKPKQKQPYIYYIHSDSFKSRNDDGCKNNNGISTTNEIIGKFQFFRKSCILLYDSKYRMNMNSVSLIMKCYLFCKLGDTLYICIHIHVYTYLFACSHSWYSYRAQIFHLPPLTISTIFDFLFIVCCFMNSLMLLLLLLLQLLIYSFKLKWNCFYPSGFFSCVCLPSNVPSGMNAICIVTVCVCACAWCYFY